MNRIQKIVKAIGNGIVRALRGIVPIRGDSRREWIRKITFLAALAVFLCSGYYLMDEMYLQPQHTHEVTSSMRDLYIHGETDGIDAEEVPEDIVYPEGLKDSFKALYARNPDIAGWLTFKTTGAEDLFEGTVDNPVVQAADNDKYLDIDFLGNKDKAGTLFFDSRNDLTRLDEERNLIIYGHNLKSGLMFSKFNLLVSQNVQRARTLETLTLDTPYGDKITYKVFAVMIVDADATGSAAFDYIRTEFSNDTQFSAFISNIRARSLYDFGDVDVTAEDQLLTLSTCSNKKDTTLKNGRTIIVARRLREGESAAVDESKTVKNEDVLMPKAWYVNQELALPERYQ